MFFPLNLFMRFLKKIKGFFLLILLSRMEKNLLFALHYGYLKEIGWTHSFQKGIPVTAQGTPIPWVTYSFLDFLMPRLKKSFSVFEFGSGCSTLFFSEHCRDVVSLEHQSSWYHKLKSRVASHVELFLVPHEAEYAQFISRVQKKVYHLIFIDAIERVACAEQAVQHLASDGVILFDDTERSEYQEAYDFLAKKGFKRLDFWGVSPGYLYRKCTTVFYRSNNCLDL